MSTKFGIEFARETWALYAVGVLGVALRWYDDSFSTFLSILLRICRELVVLTP
jgi:hypothetical protein